MSSLIERFDALCDELHTITDSGERERLVEDFVQSEAVVRHMESLRDPQRLLPLFDTLQAKLAPDD